MAEKTFSLLALERWRSRLRHTRQLAAVIVVGAVSALAGTACTAASSGTGAAGNGPPPVTVLVQGAGGGNGDIFIAPQGRGYGSGPEILTSSGKAIWFHAMPAGETATDFRTQTYQGRPVLTWFQGKGLSGTDYIYNDRYQRIAEVRAGSGYFTDFHEFLITPWNTALILADAFGTANLTSIGGPADQKVFDGIVQEIDIRTGKVLFQWDSADYVPYRDSHKPRPASATTPWDWFHINAVHLDTDGNLLISSRFTWTTYKVNLRTGKIVWELGGKQSTFKLRAVPGQALDSAGEIFAFQHDPEAIGNDVYTFFDDESDGSTTLLPHSRVVTVKLDPTTRVATLVRSVGQPEGLVVPAEGNAQTTRNGDLFVGWGALPYISEFSPSGRLLFNAELPAGVSTYRAYRLPWHPAS
ncbi:MAG TPA: arylsulfotransferase family protein [Acidimicrobiales bacterium]|nr:arylsulfotransferase family protein [Acidimicrobiales bacterium]